MNSNINNWFHNIYVKKTNLFTRPEVILFKVLLATDEQNNVLEETLIFFIKILKVALQNTWSLLLFVTIR